MNIPSHIPNLQYPQIMSSPEEISTYLQGLQKELMEYFQLGMEDTYLTITTVELDDLANTSLADPGADRIVFWDDGAGVYTWLAPTAGASITGTNLAIDHDAANNFVANEHIDHTSVSISAGAGLTGGGDISANRIISMSHLGLESLVDPDADRIMFWDDGETALKWLAPDGTTIEISGTTLQVVGGVVGGDVVGPAGATDHAVARWDTATGKLLQDSNLILDDTGKLLLAETADSNITIGLSMNMGANDNYILALKSSDIAHGVTGILETDTFFAIKKGDDARGGASFYGVTELYYGFNLYSLYTTDVTTKDTSSHAANIIQAAKKFDTGRGNMGDNANILAVRSYHDDAWGSRWIVDTEGATWQPGDATMANLVCPGTGHDGFSDFVANEHIDWTNTASNLLTTGTLGAGGPLTITQNSDTIVLSHNGADAYLKWNDGVLRLMTDEGTNTTTVVRLYGKGTGYSEIRCYDQANTTRVGFLSISDWGYIDVTGVATGLALRLGAVSKAIVYPTYFHSVGYINSVGGYRDNGTAGVDGTFVDNNGNTVTVSGGIITALT